MALIVTFFQLPPSTDHMDFVTALALTLELAEGGKLLEEYAEGSYELGEEQTKQAVAIEIVQQFYHVLGGE